MILKSRESVSRNETINLRRKKEMEHKREELFIVQDASLKNEIEEYRRRAKRGEKTRDKDRGLNSLTESSTTEERGEMQFEENTKKKT
jgi:hypothetical protein